MERNQLGTSCFSAEQGSHSLECKLERDTEVKIQHHNFMKKHEELDNRDPVKCQERKKTGYCLPYPTAKKKGFTTITQTTDDGSAKSINDTPQCKIKWKKSVENILATIQEEPFSVIWRHVPSQTNHVDFNLREASLQGTTPVTTEAISWPTTEVTTTTDNMERECVCCSSTSREGITQHLRYWTAHQSLYTAEDPLSTAGITKPTGNQSTPTGVPTSEAPPTDLREATTGVNPHPRWQGSRTSWPPNDATGSSSHHTHLTLEDCGK
jgi:hypothetical protein